MIRSKNILHLLFSLFLTGCMVGPNFKSAPPSVSDEWQQKASQDLLLTNNQVENHWWQVFEDPLLSHYIEKGIEHNQDLLKAEANILQARALKQVAASKLFPQVNFDANGSRTEFSKNGPIFTEQILAGPIPHVFQLQNLFNLLFDASWEIDLFGKTRRGVQAAEAQIKSTIEQRNDLLLSIKAEIARNYMELRSYQKRKKIIEEEIATYRQYVTVIEQSRIHGYKNELDVESIKALLSSSLSELPNTIAQIYQSIYALSVLTGSLPETLVEELLVEKSLPQAPLQIALGLRSDLLRRRPDIRKAEQDLAGATANIGVAVASFFPTFSLGLDAGLQSLHLRNLFRGNSKNWEYGGDVKLPIFQGGRLVGNLHAAKAATAASAYTYQQTILRALQETETLLKAYSEDLTTAGHLKQSVKDDLHLESLTNERLRKGYAAVAPLLDAKIRRIGAEKLLLDSDTKSLVDLVALYKALGGGWEKAPEQKELLQVLDVYQEKKQKKH